MSNIKEKFIRFKVDSDSEVYAILRLISMKNRFVQTEAISIAISSLYDVLKEKKIANMFFVDDAISLFEEGKSPSEVLSILSPKDDENRSVLKEKILKEKVKSNDTLTDTKSVKTKDEPVVKESMASVNTNEFENNIPEKPEPEPEPVEELSYFERKRRGLIILENPEPEAVEELSYFERKRRELE